MKESSKIGLAQFLARTVLEFKLSNLEAAQVFASALTLYVTKIGMEENAASAYEFVDDFMQTFSATLPDIAITIRREDQQRSQVDD